MRGFRAVLFRMVPKPKQFAEIQSFSFRAVLFRMVPKQGMLNSTYGMSFRAVLFRMVPKPFRCAVLIDLVLELCCFEWFQNP